MSTRAPLAIAAVIVALYLGFRVTHGGHAFGSGLASEPVQVVVVRSPADVERVRAAIEPERIVATTADGFAVREGRVVVADVEAAGSLISAAGWTEASIEIVKPTPREAVAPAASAAAPALASQATLTLDEALRLLQSLE